MPETPDLSLALRGSRPVKAQGEEPLFRVGDQVAIVVRYPVGHYRVPGFIRGKRGVIEAVIKPLAVENEAEGFGRNAGIKGHYYRLAVPLTEVWPEYRGPVQDGLRIEVFESWLHKI